MKIEQLMEAWNLDHLGLKSKKEEPKKTTLKLEKETKKPTYLDGVKETTSAEDTLNAAYKRVYDSFYNLIDVANGKTISGKPSTQADYTSAYKHLMLEIDKAIAVEKKTPGKIDIGHISKLRDKLIEYSPNKFNITDMEKEWNLSPKVGDKGFPVDKNGTLKTDAMPKVIKYGEIPNTDEGIAKKAKELATYNGKTDAKLMSVYFQKLKKAKAEDKDPGSVFALEPEKMFGEKTNHRKELVKELHNLGNLVPEVRSKQINFQNFYKANPNASDSKILNDLIKMAGYDFAVSKDAVINQAIVKKVQKMINDKNVSDKELEAFIDKLNNSDNANLKNETRVDKEQAEKEGKTGASKYYNMAAYVTKNNAAKKAQGALTGEGTKEEYLEKYNISKGGTADLKNESLFFGSLPSAIKSGKKEYTTRPNTEGYLVFLKAKKADNQLSITIDNETWYGYCIAKKAVETARALSKPNPITGEAGKGKVKDMSSEQKALVIKAIKEKAGVASVKTETPIFNY